MCGAPVTSQRRGPIFKIINKYFISQLIDIIRFIIFCTIEQLILLRLIVCKARIAQPYKKNIENLFFQAKIQSIKLKFKILKIIKGPHDSPRGPYGRGAPVT